MINTILIFLAIVLLYKIYKKDIKSIENFDDPIQNIKNFTKEISIYRPVESNALYQVKQKVMSKMKELGLSTTEQIFTRNINNKIYEFSNLVGINPAAKPPYILLGAHIDSPQIDGCESTIDSATGIAIILELTKNLLNKNPATSIMVLFVDGEEAIDGTWSKNNTLSGSTYFVNNYDLTLIEKVYIFDLIGGDIDKNKIAAFDNNPATYNDFNKLSNINLKYDHQIFINPKTFVASNYIEDDHVPFKEKGIYSVNLIPYKFPDSHHNLKDNYNNVNWKYIEIFYNVFHDFMNIKTVETFIEEKIVVPKKIYVYLEDNDISITNFNAIVVNTKVDWKIVVLEKNNINKFINNDNLKIYNNLEGKAFQDIVCLEVLYNNGGIFIDPEMVIRNSNYFYHYINNISFQGYDCCLLEFDNINSKSWIFMAPKNSVFIKILHELLMKQYSKMNENDIYKLRDNVIYNLMKNIHMFYVIPKYEKINIFYGISLAKSYKKGIRSNDIDKYKKNIPIIT